jgi:hypothetical protein
VRIEGVDVVLLLAEVLELVLGIEREEELES